MQVLESIALHGFFPDELPVVVKEKGKLVVIEGNRRVASLKALARPELVATKEAAIKRLLKDKGAVPFPRELDVVVAPDRISVRRLLAAKHTQTTRRPWRPLRQAYFYKSELRSGKSVSDLRREYPNVEIEKFLRLINVHHIAKALTYDAPDIAERVHNERRFPATTVERLYDDKTVRDFLGFDFDQNGEVEVTIPKAEFKKGFKKIIQDVVTKVAAGFGRVDSRTLNDEKQRFSYLQSFPKLDIPKHTKSAKIITSKDFKENKPPEPPKNRTRLAPGDIDFSLQSRGVHRMLVELQTIDYRRFANAAHDLLRSFLECALKAYFQDTGKNITPRRGKYVYLDQVLDEFVKEMTAANNNRLRQVAERIKANPGMVSYSVDFLNAANHNPDVFATPDDVEDAWDAMDALLRFVLNPARPNATPGNP
ncbi:MAG TPA: hypothetical protein VNA69_07510 [Thermoanaerobaculia bacterium]|nr:hypothetical protein [Thermoanaerobaculia bacterium]